jgi:hypothetical protein
MQTKFSSESRKVRYHLGDIGVDGRVIYIKTYFK